MTSVAYLGPDGSFTHAAALRWASALAEADAAGQAGRGDQPSDAGAAAQAGAQAGAPQWLPLSSATAVFAAVAAGRADVGVVAIENSVEGYVVPTLDALLAATDLVAISQVELEISFDAFVHPGTPITSITHVSAHPHGLAQVRRFVDSWGLAGRPAASNAAACRDLAADGMAIGPAIAGARYGLETFASAVEDFPGATTRFLVLARRDGAAGRLRRTDAPGWATMLAVTPTVTGPGVLARVLGAFAQRGVNMSSLITRPLKGSAGHYAFLITADASPWAPRMRSVLDALLDAGDAVKTLGVFPALAASVPRVAEASVPPGSVTAADDDERRTQALLWEAP